VVTRDVTTALFYFAVASRGQSTRARGSEKDRERERGGEGEGERKKGMGRAWGVRVSLCFVSPPCFINQGNKQERQARNARVAGKAAPRRGALRRDAPRRVADDSDALYAW